jgi:predicted DNA-binding ribbon-helix-helix protein
MCQLFIKADPELWRQKLRSVRLRGFSTSVRLENIYWRLLQEIAARDGLSVNEILARLYDELLEAQGEVENFASFLRVCCARYLMLQLAGDIPADPARPIAGLNAKAILAREKARLDGAGWAEPPDAPPLYFSAGPGSPRVRPG